MKGVIQLKFWVSGGRFLHLLLFIEIFIKLGIPCSELKKITNFQRNQEPPLEAEQGFLAEKQQDQFKKHVIVACRGRIEKQGLCLTKDRVWDVFEPMSEANSSNWRSLINV